jgi:predicted permease
MGSLWQDVKYGARMLGKSPGLTAIVVLTLALGVGPNMAIFRMVDHLLLQPLPVPNPEQITFLAPAQKGATFQIYRLSYPDLVDYRKQLGAFSDLFAYSVNLSGLSAGDRADQIVTNYVTGNYFSGLGLQPAAGRLFLPGEGEEKGEAPVLVLGYSYWQKRFGGDPTVVGKQVLVDGKPATVVGVTPKGFYGAYWSLETDAYLPMAGLLGFDQADGGLAVNRSARMLSVLGRLRPGVGLAQAQSSINVVAARLAKQYPDSDKDITVRVMPERRARPEPNVADVVPLIATAFLALATLILLLACMNVANVLLVRATVRQREMGIRAALGAGRGRLILLILTESIFLAILGGAAGVILEQWANSALISAMRSVSTIPVRTDVSTDWRVLSYAMAVALFTGIAVGMWPALRASRVDVNTVLRESGRSDSGGASRHRVRNVLVVAQLAGSLVLLIVAGLFVRSMVRLERTDLGFDPHGVLNVIVDPHGIGYDESRTKEFYRELESRARSLPGVQSVALAYSVPMGNIQDGRSVYIEGRPLASGEQPPLVLLNTVDPSYFGAMRVPLLRGRAFTESDNERTPLVAVVNQTMASRFWPNQDPIGKRFSMGGGNGRFVEVVGVVQNGKYSVLLLAEPAPYFYLPLAQNFTSLRTLQIRSSVPPESLVASVRQEIRSMAPDLPIIDVRTMEESLGGTNGFFMFRMGASLAGAMGLLGLVLAVVGVYGVVSYTAAQRTHEIGVRLALGAERRNILGLIFRRGMVLVIAGVVSGLIAALALTHLMARLFVGVSATDPLTYTGVTLLLAVIALWACYLPARRAMRLDPTEALRYE